MFNWEIIKNVVMGCCIYNMLIEIVDKILQRIVDKWESEDEE